MSWKKVSKYNSQTKCDNCRALIDKEAYFQKGGKVYRLCPSCVKKRNKFLKKTGEKQ